VGENGHFSETISWLVRGKFGSVACHGCSDFPKMAVFPFRDQNVAAMAAMASFFDFDNPRSKGAWCPEALHTLKFRVMVTVIPIANCQRGLS
jgi:hypothetical protein